MVKNETKALDTQVGLTDIQVTKLSQFLDTYIKVVALSGIKTSNSNEIEQSIWVLESAGFSRLQITKILHVSPNTIQAVLNGKRMTKGDVANDVR